VHHQQQQDPGSQLLQQQREADNQRLRARLLELERERQQLLEDKALAESRSAHRSRHRKRLSSHHHDCSIGLLVVSCAPILTANPPPAPTCLIPRIAPHLRFSPGLLWTVVHPACWFCWLLLLLLLLLLLPLLPTAAFCCLLLLAAAGCVLATAGCVLAAAGPLQATHIACWL